jgi:hypothetical protein
MAICTVHVVQRVEAGFTGPTAVPRWPGLRPLRWTPCQDHGACPELMADAGAGCRVLTLVLMLMLDARGCCSPTLLDS